MNTQAHYTPTQVFFWKLAGSEIHILKKCETDYNRHATTGAILLITSIFAFLAGSYAGWYFSYDYKTGQHNIFAALGFGLVWACFIYIIDRMMVISIKKDPTVEKDKQPFWKIMIPRAVIGAFIAFFISIPVELLIFSENIDRQIETDKVTELLDKKSKQDQIQDISSKESNIKSDSGDIYRLKTLLSQSCPDPQYIALKNDYNSCTEEASKLKSIYDNETAKYERMISDNPQTITNERIYYPEDVEQKSRMRSAKSNFYSKQRECSSLSKQAESISKKYFQKINQEKMDSENNLRSNVKVLADTKGSIDKYVGEQNVKLDNMKGFDTRFRALGNAAGSNGTILFLLWLIRLIFFGIEILPTYTKLTTPVGEYEWAIYNHEKNFENKMKSQIVLEQDTEYDRRFQEKERNKHIESERMRLETRLNEKILEKVVSVQEKVAMAALAEWENKFNQNGNSSTASTDT
jgi:transcription elongation GreA/GreB family factor